MHTMQVQMRGRQRSAVQAWHAECSTTTTGGGGLASDVGKAGTLRSRRFLNDSPVSGSATTCTLNTTRQAASALGQHAPPDVPRPLLLAAPSRAMQPGG